MRNRFQNKSLSLKLLKWTSVLLLGLVLFVKISAFLLIIYSTVSTVEHKSSGLFILAILVVQMLAVLLALKGLLVERVKWIVPFICISVPQIVFYYFMEINTLSIISLVLHVIVLLIVSATTFILYTNYHTNVQYERVKQEMFIEAEVPSK